MAIIKGIQKYIKVTSPTAGKRTVNRRTQRGMNKQGWSARVVVSYISGPGAIVDPPGLNPDLGSRMGGYSPVACLESGRSVGGKGRGPVPLCLAGL